MPAFITHTVFGDEVFSLLPEDVQSLLVSKYPVFSWGLIGPDLLFFRSALLGKGPLPSYGKAMHRERVPELFSVLFEALSAWQNRPEYPALLAYCCGFLCHYRLDSGGHPFVYSLQRRQDGMTPDRRRGGTHHRIEADLDAAVFQYLTGLSPAAVQIYKRFALDSGEKFAVGWLYEELLRRVYAVCVPAAEVAKCFSDALWIERLLLDPTDWVVRKLTGIVDLFQRKGPLSAHVVRKRVEYDVMNLGHEPWRRGAAGGETTGKSFLDLFWEAAEQSAKDIAALCRSQQEGAPFSMECQTPFDHDGGVLSDQKEEP